MKSTVTVLDLGSTKVAALVAELDQVGDVRPLGHSQMPCQALRRGSITELDEVGRAITQVVGTAEREAGVHNEAITVGLGGPRVEGVTAQGFVPIVPSGRAISREDVHQVINHSRQLVLPENREMLMAVPREFRVDGQRGVARPVGLPGSRLEVSTYVVSGEKEHISSVESAVSRGGRKIANMVYQPLAAGLALLTPSEMELGTAVIDLGGGMTNISVFIHGSIALGACVPIGAMHVTSDVSKLLKTSMEEAERLKLDSGGAAARIATDQESVQVLQLGQTHQRPMQRKVLCEIIESRIREIVGLCRQQIEQNGSFANLKGVILTGGGSKLPGIDMAFQEGFGQVQVKVAKSKLGGDYTVALGLAKYALESEDDDISPVESGDWKDRIRTFWSLFSSK